MAVRTADLRAGRPVGLLGYSRTLVLVHGGLNRIRIRYTMRPQVGFVHGGPTNRVLFCIGNL